MKRDDLAHAVRERLKHFPPPYQAHFGVVPLPPPEDAVLLDGIGPRLNTAGAALVRIDTLATEIEDPYLISRILPRREAISSSSIEGTNSTLDELLSVEETDGDADDAAVQVRDYALALDDLVPRARAEKHKIFTTELVQNLHRSVMTGDASYKDKPGEFRTIVVWIGGAGNIAYSTYNPAPPEDIGACLEQTMDYMRNEGMQQTQNLIVRMAIAHSHFEAVHPFRDGNGRVGRLLLPLIMAAEGHTPLYLSSYIEKHKNAYYAALKASQQRLEWHVLAEFFAHAIIGTADELMVTRDALTKLNKIWRARRKFRQGSAAFKALDILPHYPVLTTKRLAQILEVSIQASTQAIDQLVEGGMLIERTGYARNRVFASPEALTIINRPFGEAPILPD